MTVSQIHLRIPVLRSIRAVRLFHESVIAESQRTREETRARTQEKNRQKKKKTKLLAITLGPDGFWRRSDMLLAGNRPGARSTKAAVDKWLSQYYLSI
jgi:hypothetical protein